MAEIEVGELKTADRDAFFRDDGDDKVYRRVRDAAAVAQLDLAVGELEDANLELQTANTTLNNIYSVVSNLDGSGTDQTALLTEIRDELIDINTELDGQTVLMTATNAKLDLANASLDSLEIKADTIHTDLVDVNAELDTHTTRLNTIITGISDINTELDGQTVLMTAANIKLDAANTTLTNTYDLLTSEDGIVTKSWIQKKVDAGKVFVATTGEINRGTVETDHMLLLNPLGSGKTLKVFKASVLGDDRGLWRIYIRPTITANGTLLTASNMSVRVDPQGAGGQAYLSPTIAARGVNTSATRTSLETPSTEIALGDSYISIPPGFSMLITTAMNKANVSVTSILRWVEV